MNGTRARGCLLPTPFTCHTLRLSVHLWLVPLRFYSFPVEQPVSHRSKHNNPRETRRANKDLVAARVSHPDAHFTMQVAALDLRSDTAGSHWSQFRVLTRVVQCSRAGGEAGPVNNTAKSQPSDLNMDKTSASLLATVESLRPAFDSPFTHLLLLLSTCPIRGRTWVASSGHFRAIPAISRKTEKFPLFWVATHAITGPRTEEAGVDMAALRDDALTRSNSAICSVPSLSCCCGLQPLCLRLNVRTTEKLTNHSDNDFLHKQGLCHVLAHSGYTVYSFVEL